MITPVALAETVCARCCVVILAKAPRVITPITAANQIGPRRQVHPGCWAAEQRLAEDAADQLYDRVVAVGEDFRAIVAGVRR